MNPSMLRHPESFPSIHASTRRWGWLVASLAASLTAAPGMAQTFSNTGAITIPASGNASPYPSAIAVAGVAPGSFASVQVTLNGLTHGQPDNIDLLLVGPHGQTVVLMSDAGTCAVSNVNLTFVDGAVPLPSGCIVSGTYAPTNFGTGDTFSAAAPSAPYGGSLAEFVNVDPNGAWQLFVTDDAGANAGSIAGGWSITFSTTPTGSATQMTFQGLLKDAGVAVNSPTNLDFRLFSVPTGGTPLAIASRLSVPVNNGLFTTTLDFGLHNTGSLPRWIEVVANGSALSPRQQITGSPFAARAARASALDSASGGVTNAVFVDSGGNVGIRTTTPVSVLHATAFQPALTLQDTSFPDFQIGYVSLRNSVGAETGWMGFGSPGNAHATFMNARPDGNTVLGAGGNPHLHVTPAGNVGIGTSTPGVPLHISSDTLPAVILQDPGSSGTQTGYLSFRNNSFETGWFGFGTAGSTDMSIVNARSPSGNILLFPSGGMVGISTATPTTKLDVAGAIRCTTLTQTSSAAFKDNIAPLAAGLEDLLRLEPVSYTWNGKAPEDSRGKNDLGFIAEDVASVLPDAVACDAAGKPVGIDYSRITVLAVKAIKEQQAARDADRALIRSLQERLDRLEAKN